MDILELLNKYQIKVEKIGDKYRTNCPFPDHQDDSPSFILYPNTNSFYCFGCQRGGDVAQFLIHYHKISWEEAKKRLGTDNIVAEIEEIQKSNKYQEELDFNTELNYNVSKLIRGKLQSGIPIEKVFLFLKEFDNKLKNKKLNEQEAKDLIIQVQRELNV